MADLITQSLSMKRSPEVPCEILVPTVTAIIRNALDPYEVVIGTSDKHPRPVLPGGKIDRSDLLSTSIIEASCNAVHREITEETGVSIKKITFFFEWRDKERDVRVVPIKNLRESLVGDLLGDLPDDSLIKARFGVPDFVYIVDAHKQPLPDSEELRTLSWIHLKSDTRALELSAGHFEIIRRYIDDLEESSSL